MIRILIRDEIKSLPCEIWAPDRPIFSAMKARTEKLITDLDPGIPISYKNVDIYYKPVKSVLQKLRNLEIVDETSAGLFGILQKLKAH